MPVPAIQPSHSNFVGQIAVTTAGTPVAGSSVTSVSGFYICANPANTGLVWIIENATGKTKANGYPLVAYGSAVFVDIANLNQIKIDADVSGEGVCWLRA